MSKRWKTFKNTIVIAQQLFRYDTVWNVRPSKEPMSQLHFAYERPTIFEPFAPIRKTPISRAQRA